MANRFWVGGTASWDGTAGVKWATVSGGAGGAAVPTSADDVFFDAASGAATVTATNASACQNLNFTGFTGTFAGTGVNMEVKGSLTLVAGMTFSFDGGGGGGINFTSTAAGKTITTAGKNLNDSVLTFNGVGGSWTLQDNLTAGNSSTINLSAGTLDLNGKTVTVAFLIVAAAGTTLTMGAATLNLINGITLDPGMTFNANTSTINISASNGAVAGAGKTFNIVNLTSAAADTKTITGANTFATLSITNGAVVGSVISLGANQTITGTLTCNGNSSSKRPLLRSDTVGTARTITAAVFAPTDLDFMDIAGAGAASPFAGTRLGDAKGNSGITFTAAATKFWVGNSGDWDSVSWATASGGAAAANSFPLPQDPVRFDANSFSANGQTVNINGAFRIGTILFSGTDQTFNLTFNAFCIVYGDVTLDANTTVAAGIGAPTFSGRNAQTITSAGRPWATWIIDSLGGTVTLGDALTLTSSLNLTTGTFNMNGKAVSATSLSSNNTNTRSITSGGATLTLTGNGATIWQVSTLLNWTLNDVLQIDANYSGAAGTRAFSHGTGGGATQANTPNVRISAGTDSIGNAGNSFLGNFDFTGFSGTWSNAVSLTIFGSLTLSAGMTVSAGANTVFFGSAAGTRIITSNGKTMDFPVTFNAAATQLADAMTVGSSRTTTLTSSTLDLNGKTLSTGRFSSSNANVRALTFGVGGKISTTDTTAATVFDCTTGTNLTVNRAAGAAIEIGGNTANTRTFAGGGKTWPALTFTNTTAAGQLNITGSNTFKSLAVSNPPQSVMFTAGTTTTIEDDHGFPAGTAAGSRVTIGSITAANHALAKAGGGKVSRDFLSISRSDASPGTTWYAGNNSVDGGNNSGWIFTSPPKLDAMMMMFKP